MNNPIFLVSTGRTGTKYFSDFFSKYASGLVSYHTSKYTRFLNIVSNIYARNLISKSLMEKIWKGLKFKKIQNTNLRYFESNPYYYNLIDIINSFFPKSKFVCIVRNPKTFILSHIRWETQRWQSTIANCLVPFWQPTSYRDQIMGLKRDYYQRVAFYARIWNRKNTAILRQALGKKNVTTIRFEDIFDQENGIYVLSKVSDWLNLNLVKPVTKDIITKKINTSKSYTQKQWDKDCYQIVKKYCSSLAIKTGYSINDFAP